MFATIGRATRAPETMAALLRLGVSGFRFSASKFGVDELAAQAADARAASRAVGRPVDLLLDLPGSKIRFANPEIIDLDTTRVLRIHFGPWPPASEPGLVDVGLPDPELGREIGVGDVLLVGDGEIALRAVAVSDGCCTVEALTGGLLAPRKGVWLTGKAAHRRPSGARSDLDLLDRLDNSAFTGAIVSFVEDPAALAPVRARWGHRGGNAVVAKVETRAGVARIADIARAADSVLIGRGDLLLDTGVLDFHRLCASAVRRCRDVSVPVVVATQLLSGLEHSWLPLRSELAYLCGLLESGVDGLLLAAETTGGSDPLRTTRLLADLIQRYPAADRLDDKETSGCP
ncbi:pyruvate kinase [Actinoplanes sp. L3-i22]|uniref:pyruvate kinase n=1 Tax=Actinoplanes sp. L3-i22 TaxID=2836373 RepID=UPI002105B003|nr:pyruvate kinase [Actinoplanes sp. L3-i22]